MNTAKDEHVKTVYAHYGLAFYLAQCLERGLASAFIFLDLIPQKYRTVHTREALYAQFDAFMSLNFEKTLGGLIRNLHDATTVPPELKDKLTQALKCRNWLAHHFFWERVDEFMSDSGRNSMIHELEEAQKLFQITDDLLGQTIKPIREKHGVTDEILEKFLTDYLAQIPHDH